MKECIMEKVVGMYEAHESCGNLRGRYGCPILDGSGHPSGDAELREPRPFGGV